MEDSTVVLRAILSDIHGNQPALDAVLADLRRQGAEEVVCLGDVIGYGARPAECVDHARKFKWTLKGNHELALLDKEHASRFSQRAAEAIEWTRRRLANEKDAESPARMAFIEGLEEKQIEEDVIYCHGSPRLPVTEYVKPSLGKNHPERLKLLFTLFKHVAFVGHTHIAGVFLPDLVFRLPADFGNEYEVGPTKAILNVGSVGQPRDRNNRACYVLFDGKKAIYRRVRYDVDTAASQVYATDELDDDLGDRLLEGR